MRFHLERIPFGHKMRCRRPRHGQFGDELSEGVQGINDSESLCNDTIFGQPVLVY
jgi:hypothetical protein